MARHVKGSLFLDYVRMIKSLKGVDWSAYLTPDDLAYLDKRILTSQWYPMETFERMGVGILKEAARGNMDSVRLWGRMSVDALVTIYKVMVTDGDPADSLKKFSVLRANLFDYEVTEIIPRDDGGVRMKLNFRMGPPAEEAATQQMIGSMERILELSGAKNVKSKIRAKAWRGDPDTLIDISWE